MKVLVSLSGGIDSTTALALQVHDLTVSEILCCQFIYNSKHNPYEIQAGQLVAKYYNLPIITFNLTGVFNCFKSSLLKQGGEVPEGHYTDESMKSTVVPGRNTLFSSVLLGYAQSHNYSQVILGIHGGDAAVYPDCRANWLYAMQQVYSEASEGAVTLIAPLLLMNKTDIVGTGLIHTVPYELTRTCYKDQAYPCGKCGACVERLEAFKLNKSIDPVKYE